MDRYKIWAYENALINECHYKGAQPYWDWTIDTPENGRHFDQSIIFDPVIGFGGNGRDGTLMLPLASNRVPYSKTVISSKRPLEANSSIAHQALYPMSLAQCQTIQPHQLVAVSRMVHSPVSTHLLVGDTNSALQIPTALFGTLMFHLPIIHFNGKEMWCRYYERPTFLILP
jgi:hypothetical protein